MRLFSFLAIFVLLMASQGSLRAADHAPEHLTYCGMDITLTTDARLFIDEHIAKLKRSDAYFNTLVERANIYMPFVQEAFEMSGLPKDLTYIVLQESALIGDAVSTSNAVGFWQFKDFTARDVGLTVDAQLDERKHIFQSSLGAAKYFHRLHGYYGNWVYAVIAYNQGPTGALQYSDEDLFCTRKMTVTGETHWYVLKAIAHKIAFEDVVCIAPPRVFLTPFATSEAVSINGIAEKHGVSVEEVKKYNLWISQHLIPGGRQFVYYIPSDNEPPPYIPPPVVVETPPQPAAVAPVAAEEEPADEGRFRVLRPQQDADYGVEYAILQEGEIVLEIARRYGKNERKLHEWNGYTVYEKVPQGTVLRLKSMSQVKYHIARKGQSLGLVAAEYGLDPMKLVKYNRMKDEREPLEPGQKVYLRKAKPKDEPPIVIRDEKPLTDPDPVPVRRTPPAPPVVVVESGPVPRMQRNAHSQYYDRSTLRLPDQDPRWAYITVGANENIWQISKRYDWPVNMIKKINGLTSDKLSQGQKLKMMTR